MLSTILLFACSAEKTGPNHEPGTSPDVPNPETATVAVEFEARGESDFNAAPSVNVLAADDGESCVSGWMTDFLSPGNWTPGMEPFVIPSEPFQGMVYAVPEEVPDGTTDVPFYFPPTFRLDSGTFAWFGGTWTFAAWSETSVQVDFADGMTCEWDSSTLMARPETCVPDSGSLVLDNTAGEGSLLAADPGYRGYSAVALDPLSGDPLCQRISTMPGPTATGE